MNTWIGIPQRNKKIFRKEHASILILVFLAFIYLLAQALTREILIYDEGFAVYGAYRVLGGEVPYKDFWTLYAPGQFYTLALIFKIFGASLFVERVWGVLIRLLLSLVIYAIAAKLTSTRLAQIFWLIVVMVLGGVGFYGYAVFPALLFSLLSVFSLLNFLSQRGSPWLLFSGLTTGMTALYRHDIGFYTVAAEMCVLAPFLFINWVGQQGFAQKLWGVVKKMLPYLAGVSVPVISLALYLVSVVPLEELWWDLFVFPATILLKVRSLPYPSIVPEITWLGFERWIRFYFPVLVYASATVTTVALFARSGRAQYANIRLWGMMLLILLGSGFFVQAISRADSIHFLPTRIPAVLLLTTLAFLIPWSEAQLRVVRWMGLGLLLVAVPLLFGAVIRWSQSASSFWPLDCPSSLERAGCISVDPDQERAVLFVQQEVPEGRPIFVGLSRHDRIFINDIMFYFLANRPSATKYHHLHHGVATTLPVQERIIEDLTGKQVEYVVLFSGSENIIEPNQSGISSGVEALDRFLRQNYRQTRQFGNYTVWKKAGMNFR